MGTGRTLAFVGAVMLSLDLPASFLDRPGQRAGFVALLLAAAVILKGKPLLGLVGIFVPLASLVGIVRLASPGSWWARRIYGQGRKRERAQARWSRIGARRQRIGDVIAGTPPDELASTGQPPAPEPENAAD